MLAYSPSSGTFVPLTDVLGSTIGLVNSSGSIASKWTYEPFGMPTPSGPSSNYPYLFAGMEYDPTGLYHTHARYYSPRLQRFTQEDPLQYGGGDINLFTYVIDDPVNFTDPSGLLLGVFEGPALGGGEGYGIPTGMMNCGTDGSGTGPSSLGAAGVDSGQIVLTQAETDEPPDEGDIWLPDQEPSTPESWGQWKIAQNTSEAIVRGFLEGATMERYSSNFQQFRKSGGFEAADRDFDRITGDWGLGVETKPKGVRVVTLPNGTTVSVRGFSSAGSPTIQINVPNRPKIKIRY